jgi:hypothetical protein
MCHDEPVTTDQTIIITPQFPALSNAGRVLVVLALPWFFGSLIVLDTLDLIGRAAPPTQRLLGIFVAAAPIIVLVFHPWLGRLAGLQWLHHQVQPYLAIRATGLGLQLRGVGVRSYDWQEITGLRTVYGRGGDLLGPDGVVIARIPENMLLRGGNWWRSESIASVVVRARPDRFRLSGANWAGVPTEFALRAPTDSDATDDQWSKRRRWTTAAITLAFVLVSGVIILRYLTP